MKVIGVTGGAGSGKSEVMRLLSQQFNTYVILADDVARDLSLKGRECYDLIVDYFGQDILDASGEIDRKELAAKVFNNPKALEKLNSFTHPVVRRKITDLLAAAEARGCWSMAAVEAALLIESNYDTICSEYWYIYTDEAIRRQRLKETRQYTDEKIDAIMANQLSDQVFREHCRYTIVNNTSLEAVYTQISKILQADGADGKEGQNGL